MLVLHRWHLTDIDTLSPLEELDPFITYLNAVHPTMNSRATVCSHPFPLWMSTSLSSTARQNHHCPSYNCDWQAIPITLFMPPCTHQTCHFFQLSSQTQPNLLNRRYQTIYRRNKATTQRWPQQTPQTRQFTSLPTYQNISSQITTPLMTSHSFH